MKRSWLEFDIKATYNVGDAFVLNDTNENVLCVLAQIGNDKFCLVVLNSDRSPASNGNRWSDAIHCTRESITTGMIDLMAEGCDRWHYIGKIGDFIV